MLVQFRFRNVLLSALVCARSSFSMGGLSFLFRGLCGASYAVSDGLNEKRPSHRSYSGRVCLQCACESAESAHQTWQNAKCSFPSCRRRASPLCASGGEPSGVSFWCRACYNPAWGKHGLSFGSHVSTSVPRAIVRCRPRVMVGLSCCWLLTV